MVLVETDELVVLKIDKSGNLFYKNLNKKNFNQLYSWDNYSKAFNTTLCNLLIRKYKLIESPIDTLYLLRPEAFKPISLVDKLIRKQVQPSHLSGVGPDKSAKLYKTFETVRLFSHVIDEDLTGLVTDIEAYFGLEAL
jgi:hypothetical protein